MTPPGARKTSAYHGPPIECGLRRSPTPKLERARLPQIALAALALVAVAYQARWSWEGALFLAGRINRVGPPIGPSEVSSVVETVRDTGMAAGIRPGDRLLSVDGRPFHGWSTMARRLRTARPGDRVALELERPTGVRYEAAVTLGAREPRPNRAMERATVLVVGLVTPLFCLLVGFGVAALRPRDGRAWLLLFMMLSLSLITSVGMGPWSWERGRVAAVAYKNLLGPTWPIWMLLFGIYFPERLSLDGRLPWLKWLLIVPSATGALAQGVFGVLFSEDWTRGAALFRHVGPLGPIAFAASMAAIGCFFACLGYKTGTAEAPDARRRLRLVLSGALVALTPTFVIILGGLVTGRRPFDDAPVWLLFPALMVMGVLPLTLAYVIVVHRALDVRVVLRQGLQYALARRGVRVAQVLVSFAVILGALAMAANPEVNRPRRIQFMALGIMAVFLMHAGAERVRTWVDRRFFREAYDAERVLSDLGESVRTMVDSEKLLSTVTQRLSETLHVQHVGAFLAEDGRFTATHTVSLPLLPVLSSVPALERMRQTREPVRLPPGRSGTPAGLLLPLAVKDRLLGFIALGEKQSEEPYSASDLRLLRGVAMQTALALENSELTATVARETAARARLDREIEIAREVQEGLFPQRWPEVPGLRYAGHCRPARGVGGDYYDFLELDGGLAFAIGDVSGKGIPAALLMASLQASLRAQALSSPTDLGRLMSRLNALLYDTSPANRYATLFFAHYEPAQRALRYVNAGHNEPALLRGDGSVEKLRVGGPVVGLLPAATFEQASVTLRPGDVLLGYTDGVSEAMNAADEEWGEERMIAVGRECVGLAPDEVVKRVLAAADSFVAGAPQHDDMTLMVIQAT
jgi:sigma-B regulation protein RsbU (phosphoserine phosphatase)